MDSFQNSSDLRFHLDRALAGRCTIGFVPTMGALHSGHLALIAESIANNDFTVASIYVNPTQFNNPNDLKTYPRQPEKDLDLLRKAGCNAVFFPADDDLYPNGVLTGNYDLGILDEVIEGHFRPGHFQGVATVVDALFKTVQPHKAYFGEKDFQQVAVIRQMARIHHPNIQIISCPTIRETDGLAMSSRNLRLSAKQRKAATTLSKVLFFLRDQGTALPLSEAKSKALSIIEAVPEINLEYLEIVNPEAFERLSKWPNSTEVRACISAHLGDIRLIDNVGIKS